MSTELTLNTIFNNANRVSSFVRVQRLLEELKLEKYFENFELAEINDQALSLINDSCLREAGIPVGSRLIILDAIKKGKPSIDTPRLFRYQAQPNKAAAMITTPEVQITGIYQKRTSLPLHFAVPSFSMCDFHSNNSFTCGSDTSTSSTSTPYHQNSFKTRNDTPLSLHLRGYNNGQEINLQTESKRFGKSRTTSTKRKPYKNSKSCQYHYDKKASCNETCMGHIYFPRGTNIPREFWKIAKGNHIEEHVAIFKAFLTSKNLAHTVEAPVTTAVTINSGNMLLSFDQLCATLNVPLTHKCK